MTQLTFDDDAELEDWRDVVGYEGVYRVSSLGRVWSRPRTTTRGGYLKLVRNANGYLFVSLSQAGAIRRHPVHRLVAEAFLGPRPDGLEIRHLDGDQRNNRASNLRYGTRSENAQDSVRHGTNAQASKTHCSKQHRFDEANTIRRRDGSRACRACAEELRRARPPGYQHAARDRRLAAEPPTVRQACAICGQQFDRTRGTRRIYCSGPCAKKGKQRAEKARLGRAA